MEFPTFCPIGFCAGCYTRGRGGEGIVPIPPLQEPEIGELKKARTPNELVLNTLMVSIMPNIQSIDFIVNMWVTVKK